METRMVSKMRVGIEDHHWWWRGSIIRGGRAWEESYSEAFNFSFSYVEGWLASHGHIKSQKDVFMVASKLCYEVRTKMTSIRKNLQDIYIFMLDLLRDTAKLRGWYFEDWEEQHAFSTKMVKLKNDHMCQCTFVMLVVKGSEIEQRAIRQKLELHDTCRMDYPSKGWAHYF